MPISIFKFLTDLAQAFATLGLTDASQKCHEAFMAAAEQERRIRELEDQVEHLTVLGDTLNADVKRLQAALAWREPDTEHWWREIRYVGAAAPHDRYCERCDARPATAGPLCPGFWA